MTEIYKADELKKEALVLAKKVAEMSMYTAIAAKDAVKMADEAGVTEGMKFERRLFAGLFNMKAVKEGVEAFMKKKKADFNNI